MAQTSPIDDALASRFDHRYYIEQYNDSYFHIIDMNRRISGGKSSLRKTGFLDDTITDFSDYLYKQECSLSRSKRNIKRICLSNNFEYFATWTVNARYCNRFYIEDVVEKMRTLLKAFQRSNKNFQYIYIIEKHENGAFHFHGLIKGVNIGKDKKALRIYSRAEFNSLPKYILNAIEKGQEIYHIPFFDEKLGYNTFTKIKSYNKCCNYIMKYITEDMQRIASNYIYFSSRGLTKGKHYEVSFIPEALFKNCFEVKRDENLLARVKDIDITELGMEDLISWSMIQD